MDQLIRKLKAISEPVRLKAVYLLSITGELCVCEIQEILGVSPYAASRALRSLEDAGWLQSRRQGRWIYYSIADLPAGWKSCLEDLLKNAAATMHGQEINQTVTRLEENGDVKCCGPVRSLLRTGK